MNSANALPETSDIQMPALHSSPTLAAAPLVDKSRETSPSKLSENASKADSAQAQRAAPQWVHAPLEQMNAPLEQRNAPLDQRTWMSQSDQSMYYETNRMHAPMIMGNYYPVASRPARQDFELQSTVSSMANPGPLDASLCPPKHQYQSLEKYREIAKASQDPQVHLDFVRFLVATADGLTKSLVDPKKIKKNRILLHNEALKWIKQLAGSSNGLGKLGHPDAQFLLAEWYGAGSVGLSMDHEKSFSLYSQAAKQNHPSATYRVAVCYEVGAGTKKDQNKAIQYYRKACALGDTAAMYKLGMILIQGGLGLAKNPREGVTLLKRAVNQADESTPHALYELGLLYEGCSNEDVSNIIIPDLGYAFELFSRAAALGHAPSQYRLGLSFEHGLLNLPLDPRRSIAWYTKAATQGDPDAELALSGWYLTGSEQVLPQSDMDAYLWARKAADKGLAKAEFAVGYFTENGIGVRPDLTEARKWYLRAAGQGNRRSIHRLNELKVLVEEINQAKSTFKPMPSHDSSRNTSTLHTSKETKDKDCIIM